MLKKELKYNIKSLLIFSVIITVMIIVVSLVYPSIIDSNVDVDSMMKMFPKELLETFNMDIVSIKSIFGWLATEGYLFIQLLGGSYFAILGGTILLKEKNDHTIEFLYSKPISKNYILTNKLICGFIYIIIFNLITMISTFIGLSINDDLNIKKWLLLTFNPLLLNLFMFISTFYISLYFKKSSHGISAGIGFLFIMYLLNVLATISSKLEFLKYINIFNYTDSRSIIKSSSISINDVLIVTLVSFTLCLLSYYIYNKQEI